MGKVYGNVPVAVAQEKKGKEYDAMPNENNMSIGTWLFLVIIIIIIPNNL